MLPAAGLDWRNGGQVGWELIGFKSFYCQGEQAKEGHPKIDLSVGPLHRRRHGQYFPTKGANDLNRFVDASAFGHYVLDHEHTLARRYFETAPQNKSAVLLLGENEPAAQ